MKELKEYKVVFVGVKNPTVIERVFENLEDAKAYKAEHENGKFAAIVKTTESSVLLELLQEILNICESKPQAKNPLGMNGCLYDSKDETTGLVEHCVFGQHFANAGIKVDYDNLVSYTLNPSIGQVYQHLFYGILNKSKILSSVNLTDILSSIQSFADGTKEVGPRKWGYVADYVRETINKLQEQED